MVRRSLLAWLAVLAACARLPDRPPAPRPPAVVPTVAPIPARPEPEVVAFCGVDLPLATREVRCDDALADLAPLRRLPHLERLQVRLTKAAGTAPLADLAALRELSLGATGVVDLRPLAGLTSLQVLHCYGGEVTSIAPIARLGALTELEIDWVGTLDLAPLTSLRGLRRLKLDGAVLDLHALGELEELEALDLRVTDRYAGDVDYGPLAGLKGLRKLAFWPVRGHHREVVGKLDKLEELVLADLGTNPSPVVSLDVLSPLHGLRRLTVIELRIKDLRPLRRLGALEALEIPGTGVTDLSPLSGLPLRVLDCSMDDLRDLSPLSGMKTLERLDVSSTRITRLDPLAGLDRLRELTLDFTDVTEVRPLRGLRSLRKLVLDRSRIRDLDVLDGRPELEIRGR